MWMQKGMLVIMDLDKIMVSEGEQDMEEKEAHVFLDVKGLHMVL